MPTGVVDHGAEGVVEVLKEKSVLQRGLENVEMTFRTKDNGEEELEFPASSEYEVERWWGTEILSHDDGSIRMGRAKGGAMPLLFNHRVDDVIGMITGARIEKRRLMVTAKLFKTDRASEVRTMLEGGLRNVSLGYTVHTVKEDIKRQVFTATEWEPHEVSIVTVPADPTVGLGRGEFSFRMIRSGAGAQERTQQREGSAMPGVPGAGETNGSERAAGAAEVPAVTVETPAARATAQEMEANRIRAIRNMVQMNSIDSGLEDYWIKSGMSVDKVTDDMLRVMAERGKHNPKTELGLSQRETKEFSLVRAISACVENNWNNAPHELECSREIAKKLNRVPDPRRFFVPFEVQERANHVPAEAMLRAIAMMGGRRDMTVAAGGQGGFLVQTSNVGFIELLRNRSVMYAMGAQRLSGLRDSVTFPKQTVAATTTWLANEASQISEANQTFVQIAMTPKTVGGYTEISRQLLLQSNPSIEGIVTSDLATVVALDIDLKALNGSGASGQPTGLLNTSGVGTVTGTSIAYAGIVEFMTDVFAGNALTGRCGYLTTGVVAGLLKQRVKFTSTASPMWEGRLEEGNVDGYRSLASNQVPAGTLVFGDFGSVVIGEWGVLEVEVNPFADFKAGIIGVRAIASIDVAVRYPSAFSVATSVT